MHPVNNASTKLLLTALLLALIGQPTYGNSEMKSDHHAAPDGHVRASAAFIQLADHDDARNKQAPQSLNRDHGSMESLKSGRRASSGALAQNTIDFLRYSSAFRQIDYSRAVCATNMSLPLLFPPFSCFFFSSQSKIHARGSWLFLHTYPWHAHSRSIPSKVGNAIKSKVASSPHLNNFLERDNTINNETDAAFVSASSCWSAVTITHAHMVWYPPVKDGRRVNPWKKIYHHHRVALQNNKRCYLTFCFGTRTLFFCSVRWTALLPVV